MSVEQQRLEHQINNIVQKDNGCTVHYDYKELDEGFKLSSSTYNPSHNTTFLLWEGIGSTKVGVLEKLFDYVKKEIPPANSLTYKITWNKKGESFESYFNGKTVTEIVNKFFHDKNPHDFIIYEMRLMPMS